MRKSHQTTHPKIVIPPDHRVAQTADSEMETKTDSLEKRCNSSHFTPTKVHISKKLKSQEEDITNATLLQAITSQTARFDSKDEKLEALANQMRNNSIMIAETSKAVEFNSAEIKDCKEKCKELSKSVMGLTTAHNDLENRTSDLERYKREVIDLIAEIAPHLI